MSTNSQTRTPCPHTGRHVGEQNNHDSHETFVSTRLTLPDSIEIDTSDDGYAGGNGVTTTLTGPSGRTVTLDGYINDPHSLGTSHYIVTVDADARAQLISWRAQSPA
jgi:hypothetical protein